MLARSMADTGICVPDTMFLKPWRYRSSLAADQTIMYLPSRSVTVAAAAVSVEPKGANTRSTFSSTIRRS